VTITGANFGPEAPAWTAAFTRLQERGRVVFSAGIDGAVYAKHGTTFATRLTVIDKLPADDPTVFPASPGTAPDAATLMDWIGAHLPPRLPVDPSVIVPAAAPAAARSVRGYLNRAARTAPAAPMVELEGVALDYEIIDAQAGADDDGRISDAIYEEYGLQAIRISGSQSHPTKLVQSAAMASVAPPKPSYRPQLPANIRDLLSDAQLETLVYAGEAHSDYLAGAWTVDETFDLVSAARDDAEKAVRFRRGFFIGDGTGVGKGRQSAAIILDNWLQGRRKAVWISKSDKLLEDAQRDWSALGMERLLVTPLSRFPQGRPITLPEGVLLQPTPRCAPTTAARSYRASNRSLNGWVPISMEPSFSTRRTRCRMPPVVRVNVAMSLPRNRAAPGFAFSTRSRTPASPMFRRPAPPPSTISPMPSGSASGAARISRSEPAPSSSRRSKPAASRRWKCSPATCGRSASTPPAHSPSTAWNPASKVRGAALLE
jgi:hypothetical protein